MQWVLCLFAFLHGYQKKKKRKKERNQLQQTKQEVSGD